MKSKFLANLGLVSVLLFAAAGARAGTTDLANSPLVTSSSSSVQPNLLLLLDDSGSMAWNYLPDWANTSNQALFTNNAYNGVAYSAAVTYNPPVWYNADGTINTTTYPSMTSANTSGWNSVPIDGYGVQSSGTSNLVGNASFYTFVAGEYCAQPNLLNCVAQSAPSVTYPYPAALRWCTTTAMTTCHALRIETGTTYTIPRYATQAKASIALASNSTTTATTVTGITVNGVQILGSATPSATSASTMAGYIATRITLAGYSASSSGSTVTITAPAGSGSITYTPVIAKSGTMTILATPFAGGVPGQNIYTAIVSGNNSYPLPGTAAKATTRTDCAGATCTYAEEMTNYANWYAYYQTRMQMMKSSTSIAFQTVGPNYRIGYDTINNNQGSAFINPATFSAANKLAWYTKLFAASPNNSTPLRDALAKVGRFYAGMLNGSSINSVTVTDPMQYSCQQNFTIMATDGYWNETTDPTQLDGSTAIGNQDASQPRPFNDGGSATVTAATPTVSTSTDTTPRTVVDQATRTDTTTTTTSQSRSDGYVRVRVTSTNAGCGFGIATQTWRLYNGASTETQTTTTTTSTNYNVITTTGYSDAATTTTTATRTVVSTGGVVTSDTTTTTTTGPTTVTTVTSGPTVVMNPTGTPVTTTTGPTTTFSPAATLAAINWGSPYSTFTNCGAYTTSDDLYLVSNGTWSAPNTSGPTTTPGSPTESPGYPQTSSGTTVTTTTGPTTGTTTTSTATTGGTSNTLADVAEYYYATDLRSPALGNCTGSTGLPVCDNNVPSSGLDAASWQHMTLFTMALGASGYMQYFPTYATALSGDYFDVKNGTTANPGGGVCSWQASGACNWPVPVSNTQTTIDDLWHAAINGRGAYFSATNPTTLNAGLTSALAGVSARTGSSAAATTSNPNVTSGDNFVFSSTFTTQKWDGELVEQTLDLTTGIVSTTPTWTSQTQLDNRTPPGTSPSLPLTPRVIYTFKANGGNNLTSFTWATLSPTQQSYFAFPYISTLSQFCVSGITCLPAASQTNSTSGGANLVAFLGGDRLHEGVATDTTTYYRQRSHLLGDIVNAEAVYVKRPLYKYGDAGYLAWAAAPAQAGRQGMVYVAGNDGMLHAFDASNGAEAWAYIPSMVLPNLYKLADKNYTANHQYFVDGTPVVGDVYIGGAWRTILVGGLNHGGRGYYALDITDPLNPMALWEFTDANLGYTYGNPTITKLQNGKWVVLVTSGYNNVPDANYATGDGVGRLYILDARTGAQLSFSPISTGAGSVANPSGLARISAWVDHADTDNTALRVYGGDMLGNLWRFDINNVVGAPGYDAQNLMTAYTDTAGTTTQPITTRPELGSCAGAPVVFFGTGRFLGVSDLEDTTQQSFYAVKDRLGSTTYPNPQVSTTNFVQQTEINTTCPTGSPSTICSLGQQVRTSTSNAVNFASNNGWYINFPDAGERANTDPVLALGTLGWTTNIPNTNACTAGGTSFTNLVNYCTGAPVVTSTTGVMGVKLGNALATRAVFVRLPNNTVVQLTRLSDGTTMTTDVPISASCPTCARRISWRELIQDQ